MGALMVTAAEPVTVVAVGVPAKAARHGRTRADCERGQVRRVVARIGKPVGPGAGTALNCALWIHHVSLASSNVARPLVPGVLKLGAVTPWMVTPAAIAAAVSVRMIGFGELAESSGFAHSYQSPSDGSSGSVSVVPTAGDVRARRYADVEGERVGRDVVERLRDDADP